MDKLKQVQTSMINQCLSKINNIKSQIEVVERMIHDEKNEDATWFLYIGLLSKVEDLLTESVKVLQRIIES